jgi:hypothetical protein
MLKDKLPALPNINSVLSNNPFTTKEAEVVAPDMSNTQAVKDSLATLAIEAPAPEVQQATTESILTADQVDQGPEFTGSTFEYNDNLHVENGAPDDMYEVVVSYVVETDGTISNATASSNNGYGLEEEIVKALNATSGQWNPAQKNGVFVRCLLTNTFKFPEEK